MAQGDRRTERDIVASLAHIEHLSGRFEQARVIYPRVVTLARELGDHRGECSALGLLGNLLVVLDEHDAAENYLRTQLAVAREHGIRDGQLSASFGLTTIAMWRGDYADARAHLERQIELSRGLPSRAALAHATFAQLCYEMGQLDEAERNVALGLERAEAGQLRHLVCFLRACAAEDARTRGNGAAAEALYRDAVLIAREVGAQHAVAEAQLGLGRLLLELGHANEARRCLRESAELSSRLQLESPGPLPQAYLALLGDAPATGLADGPPGICSLWAELHLVLHRAGAGASHLAEAGELLSRMSRHLEGLALVAFWSNFPPARLYRTEAARHSPVAGFTPLG